VTEAKFAHCGSSMEAGIERQLDFEFAAIAVGATGETLARVPLGADVEIDGFVAPTSKRSQRLRVHITDYHEISGD